MARSSVQSPVQPSRSPPLPSPTNDAMYHTYRSDLSQVRALVLQHAREAGLTEGRANDLVLAVSEVAANTLRHTQSSGTLAIWHDEDEVVCEVHDGGTITDPSVGTRKPPPDASGGGLRLPTSGSVIVPSSWISQTTSSASCQMASVPDDRVCRSVLAATSLTASTRSLALPSVRPAALACCSTRARTCDKSERYV